MLDYLYCIQKYLNTNLKKKNYDTYYMIGRFEHYTQLFCN